MNQPKGNRGAPWKVAELKQLGRVPDPVLARRTGRSIKEVVAMRESRRIGLETGPRRWTAREIRLLGTMNDHELARRLRRPKHHVRRQRLALKIRPFKPRPKFRYWKSAEVSLLGTMPDADLAMKLRRTFTSVQVERIRRGIPMFNNTRLWKPEHVQLLGRISDKEMAELTGRSITAVRSINGLRKRKRCSAPSPTKNSRAGWDFRLGPWRTAVAGLVAAFASPIAVRGPGATEERHGAALAITSTMTGVVRQWAVVRVFLYEAPAQRMEEAKRALIRAILTTQVRPGWLEAEMKGSRDRMNIALKTQRELNDLARQS